MMTQRSEVRGLYQSKHLDYELIDFGKGRKLERFGKVVIDRPEIHATSSPLEGKAIWQSAHWRFEEKSPKKGDWVQLKTAPSDWTIRYVNQNSVEIKLKLTQFKHIGVFPEQSENWSYVESKIKTHKGSNKVLNLFAYTGVASIIAAKSGATVTNVDSVKQITHWAKENAIENYIDSVRWIIEDARKFALKCERRGEHFHGIILDPPAYGIGSKKEHWKLERDLQGLLKTVSNILHKKDSFIILNTYSPKINLKELRSLIGIAGFSLSHSEFHNLGVLSNKGKYLPLGQLARVLRP